MAPDIVVLCSMLAVGLVIGRRLETNHYKSIHEREKQLLRLPAVTGKQIPGGATVRDVRLVSGSVVVSVDYYKRFLAGLRMLFGGELASYSSLLDRARREAILRMKESAVDADLIANCRLETATLSSGGRNTVGSVEVLAYGTAVTLERA